MTRRVDYYHDPDAPPANSIVVAVTAFIQGSTGRLLMIRCTDTISMLFQEERKKSVKP
jgi:hypothetical protein